MAPVLLLDGFNLAFRAFFAVPDLTRSDGFPTNAIYGWIRTLWKLEDSEKPSRMTVFFDSGGSQDRLALHPEYKAQRAEMPFPLEQQIPILKELTRALGWPVIEELGVESDDLLAAEAHRLAERGHTVGIVSADKDFAQCVNDRIFLLIPPPTANPKLGWKRLDAKGVEEKFGVPPRLIPDYLALVGDTSDNIPGLSGVGPKTASKWLHEHGSLEAILEKAASLTPARFQTIVAEATDRLRLNLKLVTLNLGAGQPVIAQENPQPATIFEILEGMEMPTHLREARKRYSLQGELL